MGGINNSCNNNNNKLECQDSGHDDAGLRLGLCSVCVCVCWSCRRAVAMRAASRCPRPGGFCNRELPVSKVQGRKMRFSIGEQYPLIPRHVTEQWAAVATMGRCCKTRFLLWAFLRPWVGKGGENSVRVFF